MLEIQRDDIEKYQGGFRYFCTHCGSMRWTKYKVVATRAIDNRTKCLNCKKPYQVERIESSEGIYRNEEGKWCCQCSGCGIEQAYTRADHARQSVRADWKCRKCATYKNHISRAAYYQGFMVVDYDKFMRSAHGRGLCWEIDIDFVCSMWEAQKGLCALSGLPMEKTPKTWSIDRIKNDVGYTKDNVQLVLNEVNMMKQKYDEDQYISFCCAVAKHRGCL